jgi:hypothetical protein
MVPDDVKKAIEELDDLFSNNTKVSGFCGEWLAIRSRLEGLAAENDRLRKIEEERWSVVATRNAAVMHANETEQKRAEILQAHTALVARLHDVTTMLEAYRARIEGAPVGIVDAEMVVPEGFRLYPEDLWDKRVALVVLP